ncbi:MAG: hypothetical protein AAF387_22590, partial [Pseudomonadota bacterium]
MDSGRRSFLKLSVSYAALLASAQISVAGESCAPNLLLYNGRITTLDDSIGDVSAIAIRDGAICAVGDDDKIRALGDV